MGRNIRKPECHACECGDHVWAPLTRGYVALASPEDAHFLESRTYAALPKPKKNKPYGSAVDRVTVVRSENGRGTIQLHREIMQPPEGMVVDHANRNTLDNRRSNLRLATPTQNRANSVRKNGGTGFSSRFVGVSWDRKLKNWRARMQVAGKNIHLGNFAKEEDAGAAYAKAAAERYGDFARASQ